MSKESFKFKTNDKIVYFNLYNKNKLNNLTNIQNYDKSYWSWKAIKRADDPTKEISPLATNLCSRLVYAIRKNNKIFKSNDWFKNITKKCKQQNLRIRNQLTNIFNFQFHHQVRVNNEILFNVFEISFTDDAAEILNLEDLKKCSDLKTKNVPTSKQKCSDLKTKMFRSYIDKEKEESLRDYSSFSDNEDIEEEKLEEIESSPCASFLNKQAQVRKEKKEEIPAPDIRAVKGQKRTSGASAVEYNSILKLDQSVLFKKFKDNISDTEILKDFENLHALYNYSADNETIILECTTFFSDRITQSNKIDDLQVAITKIDKTLIIKHRCIYRNDIIIYPNN